MADGGAHLPAQPVEGKPGRPQVVGHRRRAPGTPGPHPTHAQGRHPLLHIAALAVCAGCCLSKPFAHNPCCIHDRLLLPVGVGQERWATLHLNCLLTSSCDQTAVCRQRQWPAAIRLLCAGDNNCQLQSDCGVLATTIASCNQTAVCWQRPLPAVIRLHCALAGFGATAAEVQHAQLQGRAQHCSAGPGKLHEAVPCLHHAAAASPSGCPSQAAHT